MIAGIIAEYNPFHNGHLAQIKMLKERGAKIVVVMSGSFTQRGDAAVVDKWQRAKAAVTGGADIVIELPFIFAVRSAEHFAAGGARLIDSLGIADTLAFGAECQDAGLLLKIADLSKSTETQKRLNSGIKKGLSYAAALESAILDENLRNVIHMPNNILGIEYINAIKKYNLNLTPLPLPRIGAEHLSSGSYGSFASGTAIREMIFSEKSDKCAVLNLVPEYMSEILGTGNLANISRIYRVLTARIITEKNFGNFYGIGEGIENRLLRFAGAPSFEEFVCSVSSRRYSRARVQRMALYLMLGITKEFAMEADAQAPPYARILAANFTGRELLKKIKMNGKVTLINKAARFLKKSSKVSEFFRNMLKLDVMSTNFHALCYDQVMPLNSDFLKSAVIL